MRHPVSLESYANAAVVEFATVGTTKSGSIYHHLWSNTEIDSLLKQHDLAKPTDSETTEQALGNAGTAELKGET